MRQKVETDIETKKIVATPKARFARPDEKSWEIAQRTSSKTTRNKLHRIAEDIKSFNVLKWPSCSSIRIFFEFRIENRIVQKEARKPIKIDANVMDAWANSTGKSCGPSKKAPTADTTADKTIGLHFSHQISISVTIQGKQLSRVVLSRLFPKKRVWPHPAIAC